MPTRKALGRLLILFLVSGNGYAGAEGELNENNRAALHSAALGAFHSHLNQKTTWPGGIPDHAGSQTDRFDIRVAALAMDKVVDLFEMDENVRHKAQYLRQLLDYERFCARTQALSTPSGTAAVQAPLVDYFWNDLGRLGEPAFSLGAPLTPLPNAKLTQNDARALEAITLGHFSRALRQTPDYQMRQLPDEVTVDREVARLLSTTARDEFVNGELYRVLKMDAEFASLSFQGRPTYDVWGETKAQEHFFTGMMQRRALVEAEQAARAKGGSETGAADYYRARIQEMETRLQSFSNARRIYLAAFRQPLPEAGGSLRSEDRDASVILASLYGNRPGDTKNAFFPASDPQILATAANLMEAFRASYPVNGPDQRQEWIGRYPMGRIASAEDHPGVVETYAFGELFHRAAREISSQGALPVTSENRAFFRLIAPATAMKAGTTLRADGPKAESARFRQVVSLLDAHGDRFIDTVIQATKSPRISARAEFSFPERVDAERGVPHLAPTDARGVSRGIPLSLWSCVSALRACETR